MDKYQEENRNDIIQRVEIDLTEIRDRQDLESRINEYLQYEGKSIFEFEAGNKLVYETEVLIPKVNKNRLNILMVLGNPAVHSVAERMFFSYEKTRIEGKWREHRFWRTLRELDILKFDSKPEKPTRQNIGEINKYKRVHLLNGDYISHFNIFLLPYFSFPTPASKEFNGVAGIRKIVGKEIFEEMKVREFERFEGIVKGKDIKNVICFQKTDAGKEIICKAEGKQIGKILGNPRYPVYRLGGYLENVILYMAPPTRDFYKVEGKKILKGIIAELEQKSTGCSSPNRAF